MDKIIDTKDLTEFDRRLFYSMQIACVSRAIHYYTFRKDPQLRSFVLIRLFCILILKNLLDKY